jgi:hypothetical protein
MIVIDLGYRKVVMPKEKAMLLMDCLESAEIYEERYWSEEDRKALGMTGTYTYHVYPNDTNFSMQIMSDSKYQMAKLAGKSTKE